MQVAPPPAPHEHDRLTSTNHEEGHVVSSTSGPISFPSSDVVLSLPDGVGADEEDASDVFRGGTRATSRRCQTPSRVIADGVLLVQLGAGPAGLHIVRSLCSTVVLLVAGWWVRNAPPRELSASLEVESRRSPAAAFAGIVLGSALVHAVFLAPCRGIASALEQVLFAEAAKCADSPLLGLHLRRSWVLCGLYISGMQLLVFAVGHAGLVAVFGETVGDASYAWLVWGGPTSLGMSANACLQRFSRVLRRTLAATAAAVNTGASRASKTPPAVSSVDVMPWYGLGARVYVAGQVVAAAAVVLTVFYAGPHGVGPTAGAVAGCRMLPLGLGLLSVAALRRRSERVRQAVGTWSAWEVVEKDDMIQFISSAVLPCVLQACAESWWVELLAILAALLGPEPLSAWALTASTWTLLFAVGAGAFVAGSNVIRMSLNDGQPSRAQRRSVRVLLWAALLAVGVGALLAVSWRHGKMLPAVFSGHTERVYAEVRALSVWLACVLALDVASSGLHGVLRAAGDSVVVSSVTVASQWASVVLGATILAVWRSTTAIAVAVLLAFTFQTCVACVRLLRLDWHAAWRRRLDSGATDDATDDGTETELTTRSASIFCSASLATVEETPRSTAPAAAAG